MSKQYAATRPLTQNSSETLLQTISHSEWQQTVAVTEAAVEFQWISEKQIKGLQLNLFFKDSILSLLGCFSIPPAKLDKWHVISLLFRWQMLHDLWFDWHRPACLAQVPANTSVTAWLWQQEKLVLNKKSFISLTRREFVTAYYWIFLDSNRSLRWFLNDVQIYWLCSYLTQRQRPASGSNPEKAGSNDKLALKQESTLGLTAEEVSQARLWQHSSSNLPWRH